MKKKTWHVSYQAPERFGLCNNKGFKAAAICQNHHEHRCGPPRVAGQFPKDKASIKMHAFVLLGNISLYEKLSACRSSIYCKAQLYCSRNMWNIQSNQILHSADQCFNSSGWLRACELPPRVAARSQLSPRFV